MQIATPTLNRTSVSLITNDYTRIRTRDLTVGNHTFWPFRPTSKGTQILNKPGVLTKQETVYNYRAIFRFLYTAVSAVPSCVFIPGENRPKAIRKELERQDMSTKSYYNADGIILDSDT